MTMSEKTYRVGDRDVFVAEAGDGPAVLLLHGGGPGASGVSNYVRNIEPLAEHYRVIVPDLPGYGRSTKNVDQTDPFGDLANAVRDLLDELGLGSAHLVGNSLGASAALRLALDTPDRAGRLVLMGPGGIGTTRALPTPGLQKLINYYRGAGPSRRKLEEFIRHYLVFDGTAIPDEAIEQRYQASIDPEVVAAPPLQRPSSLKTLWRMDFTRDRRLRQLRTPTLAFWGADDKVNRPSGGRTLADTMPNCDLLLVANTGHWVQWERAELFNATLRTFLGGAA
ncbi:alpha/beta fold hydrolase [Amycolatopsis stemonae]